MKQLTEQEYEDLYNKRAVMQTLKKGRQPRRNSAVSTIFYLSGFGALYTDSILSHHKPLLTTKERTTVHYIRGYDPFIAKGFQKYIRNFEATDLTIEEARYTKCGAARRMHTYHHGNHYNAYVLTLHYNPRDVQWWLIDYDLLKYHGNNIREDKNTNFLYIKDIRKNKHVVATQKYI